MAAVTSAATALPPTSLLLAADDVFGEVFMAGMSIAFAAVGATVLAGVIIRGKYDEIEKSMIAVFCQSRIDMARWRVPHCVVSTEGQGQGEFVLLERERQK